MFKVKHSLVPENISDLFDIKNTQYNLRTSDFELPRFETVRFGAMATAQAMREQEKTVTWSSIFPSQQVTEQQSALFVKKLLAVAVSSITYLRTIFPEHAFGDRCLEDLNLKILKDDSACPGACQVIQWIKGCFDALDKGYDDYYWCKYLRAVFIESCDDNFQNKHSSNFYNSNQIYGDAENPDTVIETYTFKFSYVGSEVSIFRNGNKIASAHTEKETKKATIRLLRTIILLSQTLASLPDDVMMTMKLLYYDEVTPLDYEPPGFKNYRNDNTQQVRVKLRIKTDCQQFELKDEKFNEEASNIDLEPVTIPSKENSLQDSSTQQQQEEAGKRVNSMSSPCDVEQEGRKMSEQIRTVEDKGVEDMDCDKELPGKIIWLLMPLKFFKNCRTCSTKSEKVQNPHGYASNNLTIVHLFCTSFSTIASSPLFHPIDQSQQDGEEVIKVKCPCGNDEGAYSGKCTDSSLVNLNTVALQATCLWRKTLLACSELNRVLPNTLARHLKLEMSIAQGLVKRLEKEGFIRSTLKGKRLGKIVNKKKLQAEGFGKYFNKRSGKLGIDVDLSDKVVPDGNKSVDGVEAIVQRCSKMDVSGTVETIKKKMCNKQGKLKRAVSLKDETTEFDISNSQEQCFEDRPQSKRKKASVAKSAILV
ncbi:HORMA domain-containing protein 1 [Stylophora pistillata]|uniref:HORMA domain-containing protein 1 n=1 Tax=Stylophora pistillata TaxID=50429 RepID=A0A2B4S777_STYPI|nr:HORMA domain-containing protein 1 [Stylophora pistillata]